MFNKIKILKNENGSILITFVILMGILTSILMYSASTSLANKVGIEGTYKKAVALNIAEAGAEKAIWEIQQAPTYIGETGNSSMSGGQFDVVVTGTGTDRIVESTAYVPTKANAKFKKKVRVKMSATPSNTDISFAYAVQSGQGGMEILGSSNIEGSLYSNGNILVTGSAEIHDPGNAWAVGTITDDGRIKGTKTTPAPAVPLPTLDLDAWKNLAKTGGTISGNYSPSGDVTVGPKEIMGSMDVGANDNITLSGPLYIHGDFSMNSNQASMKPSDALGTNGTMVVVDGKIDITGGKFYDNSAQGYIAFVSTNSAITKGNEAIKYTGNNEAERVSFYAYNGAMSLAGSGKIAAMIGQKLFINSGKIEYEHGTPVVKFPGAPGGAWVVKEWQEIKAP